MSYDKWAALIRALGLPEKAIAFATGDSRLPEERGEVPFWSYGFPPALIPLWGNPSGPGYYGFWWHFGGHRRTTIVKLIVEAGYRAYEYARSFEQLMTIIALKTLVADERISEELRDFAAVAGVDDLEGLDGIAEESSDQLFGLLRRPEFRGDAPVECFGEQDRGAYRGDFPTELNVERSNDLSRFAGLEGEKTVAERIAAQPNAPPWFKSRRQREVFDLCMRLGDYQGAWMSLNSPGWRFSDAGVALAELTQRTGDPILRLLSEAWSSERHADFGGY